MYRLDTHKVPLSYAGLRCFKTLEAAIDLQKEGGAYFDTHTLSNLMHPHSLLRNVNRT